MQLLRHVIPQHEKVKNTVLKHSGYTVMGRLAFEDVGWYCWLLLFNSSL